MVIVRDMSRFDRDCLQAGCCTEMFFPEREIRFIAAVNDVSSKKPGNGSELLLVPERDEIASISALIALISALMVQWSDCRNMHIMVN